ncbi:MAG: response regulator receiver [Frankiales bacterium]|nr:response regulator receiver [Frankiales bacterium]
MIRLMLVDDHALVRAGLGQLIEPACDIEVVAQAAEGAEAVAFVRRSGSRQRPDVVLMDVSMPVLDGAAATRQIIELDPAIRVVALTSFADQHAVLAMLDAGAVGYLVKDAAPAEILEGIRAAARGEAPLSLAASTALVRARARRTPDVVLTARERDVLALLTNGLSNRVIGRRLGISEATVKAHLTRVYQSIGVSDRTSAALRALQLGLVERA